MKSHISLNNRIALVTGASKGLGRAIAVKFAQAGADVILVSHRDQNELDQTTREIINLGRRALPILGDVSNSSNVEQIISEVDRHFDGLDILVNNAGYSGKQGWGTDISGISIEDFDRTLEVDVRGTFLMCKSAYPLLLKRSPSNIINMTSGASIMGDPAVLLFSAAKSGVHGLTKALATAWAPRIRVNAIGPGAIRTSWIENWSVPTKDLHLLEKQIPMMRLGTPDDVANAALFLACDLSAYVTGQTLIVDGGLMRT